MMETKEPRVTIYNEDAPIRIRVDLGYTKRIENAGEEYWIKPNVSVEVELAEGVGVSQGVEELSKYVQKAVQRRERQLSKLLGVE